MAKGRTLRKRGACRAWRRRSRTWRMPRRLRNGQAQTAEGMRARRREAHSAALGPSAVAQVSDSPNSLSQSPNQHTSIEESLGNSSRGGEASPPLLYCSAVEKETVSVSAVAVVSTACVLEELQSLGSGMGHYARGEPSAERLHCNSGCSRTCVGWSLHTVLHRHTFLYSFGRCTLTGRG